jgi:hypothetical protein
MRPLKRRLLPSLGSEAQGFVLWRTGRLRDAGFSPQLAERVARGGAYDLHAVLELVDRGCPPELAARILAPIDEEQPC